MSQALRLLFEILRHRLWARFLVLFVSFLGAGFGLFAPYFQKEFIDSLLPASNNPMFHLVPVDNPLLLIFLAFTCLLISQGFIQLTNYLGYREALIMQRQLADRLYRKMLALRVDTMSRRPVGEVVSIYATDVPGATVVLDQTLPAGASTLFPLLLAPFALAWTFDIPVWPTIGMMLVVSLINGALAFRQSTFFFHFKALAAQRIGLINEWVQNIRTLRILSWIPYFENQIFDVREVETLNRVRMVTNGQTMNAISSSVTFALNVITLGTLIFYTKKTLSAGETLALLWILGVFLTRPFRQMPWFFTFMFDSWTSILRLSEFLGTHEEKTEPPTAAVAAAAQPSTWSLNVKGLNLTIQNRKILQDIEFQIKPGEFVAIVGEVGAGKTLLLLSLLRETAAHFKTYQILGEDALSVTDNETRQKFSYVPQEGFIMSASLRENVAFLYDTPTNVDMAISESLRLAQFDLRGEDFPMALETEIGERGVNLSGGQKQRVSLARVDFLKTSILLLDDCLSALDVKTEEKLLHSLVKGAWKDKTRLLVTHRLSVLPQVDRIFFMSHGRILQIGTYEQLLRENKQFQKYTQTIRNEGTHEETNP